MKFTIVIFALLISASAFSHGGHRGHNHHKAVYGTPNAGHGYRSVVLCGNYQCSGGNVGVHNGYAGHKTVAGNLYFDQSNGRCTPNGYSVQNLGGSVGVVNGQIGGGVYFNQSTSR